MCRHVRAICSLRVTAAVKRYEDAKDLQIARASHDSSARQGNHIETHTRYDLHATVIEAELPTRIPAMHIESMKIGQKNIAYVYIPRTRIAEGQGETEAGHYRKEW